MWQKRYPNWSWDLSLQIRAQRFSFLRAFPVKLGSLWTGFQKTLPWKRDGEKCGAEEDRCYLQGS